MAIVWNCNSCPAHGNGLESSDRHMRKYHPELLRYEKDKPETHDPMGFKITGKKYNTRIGD